MYLDSAGPLYDPRGWGRHGNLRSNDYSSWGYIVLYLVSATPSHNIKGCLYKDGGGEQSLCFLYLAPLFSIQINNAFKFLSTIHNSASVF
jgi:hypothetical protein